MKTNKDEELATNVLDTRYMRIKNNWAKTDINYAPQTTISHVLAVMNVFSKIDEIKNSGGFSDPAKRQEVLELFTRVGDLIEGFEKRNADHKASPNPHWGRGF